MDYKHLLKDRPKDSPAKFVFFDIDGTVADISHRLHFIQSEPKDWASFHAAATDDEPMKDMVSIVIALFKQSYNDGYYPIFVTGRPESSREITLKWLNQAFGIYFIDDELAMRKNGDYRPDHVIKRELVQNLRKLGHDVVLAVEDRQQVVDMYREEGIRCLQCADGRY